RRRLQVAALLQPGVVVDAQPGQLGDLLPAQPGRAPRPGQRQAQLARVDPLPAGPQEGGELPAQLLAVLGGCVHRLILACVAPASLGPAIPGSPRTGTISVVQPDGTTTPLVGDPGVVSTFGLTVDVRRGRLLAAYADLGIGAGSGPDTLQQQSGLLIADLASGRVLQRVPLGSGP